MTDQSRNDMLDERAESNALLPTIPEIAIFVMTMTHMALLVFVLVQVVRKKNVIPHGFVGYVVLFSIPVLGPLLVLARQRRPSERVMG